LPEYALCPRYGYRGQRSFRHCVGERDGWPPGAGGTGGVARPADARVRWRRTAARAKAGSLRARRWSLGARRRSLGSPGAGGVPEHSGEFLGLLAGQHDGGLGSSVAGEPHVPSPIRVWPGDDQGGGLTLQGLNPQHRAERLTGSAHVGSSHLGDAHRALASGRSASVRLSLIVGKTTGVDGVPECVSAVCVGVRGCASRAEVPSRGSGRYGTGHHLVAIMGMGDDGLTERADWCAH